MASPDEMKPHAVVVPYPAQGHINPLMQLSKLMSLNGFSVTFVHSENNLQRVLRAQGQAGIPLPEVLGQDIHLVGISDGFQPADYDRVSHSYEERLRGVQEIMGLEFERLMVKLSCEGPPVTCIIADYFLPWAQDVAEKFNTPRIILWPQSVAVFAVYAQTPCLISKGFIDPSKGTVCMKETANLLSCTIPGLPSLGASNLPYLHTESLQRWLFGVIDKASRHITGAAWILCNSFNELENKILDSVRKTVPLYPIGPLLPSAFGREDLEDRSGASLWREDECIEWLNTQAALTVLYISVGSHVLITKQHMEELAHGLKLSKQPFLWVIRGHTGIMSLVETLPEGFLEDTKDQGLIVAWAPQVRVLSHPAVGGFLTHCGWNSTIESITMGVPMIAWNWIADQRINSKLLVDGWKIGVELVRPKQGLDEEEKLEQPPLETDVGRLEVERAVRIVMQGEEGIEMRRAACKLRDAAKRATSECGDSNKNLHMVFHDLKLRARKQL